MKLILNRETVRQLSNTVLSGVVGGLLQTPSIAQECPPNPTVSCNFTCVGTKCVGTVCACA